MAVLLVNNTMEQCNSTDNVYNNVFAGIVKDAQA